MVQGRRGPGLLLEAPQALRVLGELRGQHLDGHLPPQPRVPGPVHLAHAPRAEGGENFVRAEAAVYRFLSRLTDWQFFLPYPRSSSSGLLLLSIS